MSKTKKTVKTLASLSTSMSLKKWVKLAWVAITSWWSQRQVTYSRLDQTSMDSLEYVTRNSLTTTITQSILASCIILKIQFRSHSLLMQGNTNRIPRISRIRRQVQWSRLLVVMSSVLHWLNQVNFTHGVSWTMDGWESEQLAERANQPARTPTQTFHNLLSSRKTALRTLKLQDLWHMPE